MILINTDNIYSKVPHSTMAPQHSTAQCPHSTVALQYNGPTIQWPHSTVAPHNNGKKLYYRVLVKLTNFSPISLTDPV